jgi:drug/metabolite transporter (DMT)-like permease
MSTAEALPAAPHQRHELDRLAVLTMLLICIIWGFNQISIKLASPGIAPVLQSALRSAGATVLLFLWCRSRGIALFTRDGTIVPGLAAGLLFAVQFLLMYWGLSFTTVSRAIIFIYMAPFVVALSAHFLIPDDRLTVVKTIGLVGAFAGMAIAFADGLRLPTNSELVGDAMCFVGAIASGATTVLIKASRLARASAEKTLLYQLAVSAPVLAAVVPFFEDSLRLSLTPLVAAAMLYQTLVVAFASYVTWFWLMRSYPASRLSAFTFLTPALGVAFGGLLLGEKITPALVAAVALIAAGLYLVNRPARVG